MVDPDEAVDRATAEFTALRRELRAENRARRLQFWGGLLLAAVIVIAGAVSVGFVYFDSRSERDRICDIIADQALDQVDALIAASERANPDRTPEEVDRAEQAAADYRAGVEAAVADCP